MKTLVKYNVKEEKGFIIIELSGELDETNVDDTFEDIYNKIGNLTGKNVVLDLYGLGYINSKTIGYIAEILGTIEESGGKFHIANAGEEVNVILSTVGLSEIIPMFSSLEEALQ